MKNLFLKILQHRRFKQIGSLYFAMVLNIVLAFIVSIINTRTLGPEQYGDYRYIVNIFLFFTSISSLGFAVTSGQLIAQMDTHDTRKHLLIGTNIIIALIISSVFVLGVVTCLVVKPEILPDGLLFVVLLVSPIILVYSINPHVEQALQGDNRIHELSLFRVLPNIMLVLVLLFFKYFYHLDVRITLMLQLLVGYITLAIYYRKLQPRFTDFRENFKKIWAANKKYGLHVYTGSLSGVATGYLSTFMISYFLDNTHVGYFSLASHLTLPLLQIPSVVGTTYFKEFARADKLPAKVTTLTICVTLLSVAAFVLLIKPIIVLVYSDKYIGVAYIATIIAFGSGVFGLGDYFNRFLGAHGKGKLLRNGAIVVGVINVLGYYFLIKHFGIEGAMVTQILAAFAYCGMMVYYYFRFQKEERSVDAEQPPILFE